MRIDGKVHCLFEQSGTFKNEFIKLGYQAFDYDIQNNFNETDYVIDLFAEIDKAYEQNRTEQNRTEQNRTEQTSTIFDSMSSDDLIIAFFPCIHFCDAKTLIFRGEHIGQRNKPIEWIMCKNIEYAKEREYFYEILMKFVFVCCHKKIRLVIENPYNTSGMTFLENNFFKPSVIDNNRMLRGDYFYKPTGYWFFNCKPTHGFSYQNDKKQKVIMNEKGGKPGICSEERSMISPDYARNFICDFILGKQQKCIAQQQFEFD